MSFTYLGDQVHLALGPVQIIHYFLSSMVRQGSLHLRNIAEKKTDL